MGCLNDWEIVQLGPDSYREGNWEIAAILKDTQIEALLILE